MKQPQRGKGANPTSQPQAVEVLTRTRLLAVYEGLVVLSRILATPPPATGGVMSAELYDASGCVFDRVVATKALVTGVLAQPGNPDRGAIRAAYDEILEAWAGVAIAPAALSWSNPGSEAQTAGSAWLRELERVLGANLAQLRELVAGLGEDKPANTPRGR